MKRPLDTDTFRFVNLNTHNRKAGDCVFRALANAFEIKWEDALKACVVIALKKGVSPDDTACYAKLFDILGIPKRAQPRKWDFTKYTGSQFCREIVGSGVYVAHLGGNHIVAIRDGRVEDTWNSTGGCIGNYWEIPGGDELAKARKTILELAAKLGK